MLDCDNLPIQLRVVWRWLILRLPANIKTDHDSFRQTHSSYSLHISEDPPGYFIELTRQLGISSHLPITAPGADIACILVSLAAWTPSPVATVLSCLAPSTPPMATADPSRRPQQSTPSRSHSTRYKSTVPPSPQRAESQGHHRTSSRHAAIEDILPQQDYETSNIAQTPRRSSSKDRPLPARSVSQRSSSGRHRSGHHSREMSTAVANGGGPAPVVTPSESRHAHSRSGGKSRTTIRM